MNTPSVQRFLSAEILIACIGFAIAGVAAWTDVKSEIAVNAEAIEQQEKQNSERYESLREGQKDIEDLLNQLLLQKAANNSGHDHEDN